MTSQSPKPRRIRKMRMFPSLDSWSQSELEGLKTWTLLAGAIAVALSVLLGFWWNEFRERINARIETLSQQSESVPVFTARTRTTIYLPSIDATPFFVAIPHTANASAYSISVAMFIQLRNNSPAARMIDSYSFEAKSDRGNWEVMRIADVRGPGGERGGELLYTWRPKLGRVEPSESFTDAVRKKNLHPGETIQGFVFLTMPRDWMAGEYRIRIRDSADEELLVPISTKHSQSTTTMGAQAASFKMLDANIDPASYKPIGPARSAE